MQHENFQSHTEAPKAPSERNFGTTFTVVFTIIGLLPLIARRPPRIWSLAAAAVFLVLTLAWPAALAWPNRLWLRFGLFLHSVVSPLVLGILFYAVVTPTGLFLRFLLRKELIPRGPERGLRTYWIERRPPGPDPETLTRQF